MIHYLFPYSTEKNIGKAYNDAIGSLIPEPNDWIVIKDGDAMFLTPEWGRQIDEVSKTTDFDLIGCVTGRLRSKTQLYKGRFDSVCNMYMNFDNAREAESLFWGQVEEVSRIAGMFMMFQYKTWQKVRFQEGTVKADMAFNRNVKSLGGKVGIIKGLYCFHGYRLWERTHHGAMSSFKHLTQKA